MQRLDTPCIYYISSSSAVNCETSRHKLLCDVPTCGKGLFCVNGIYVYICRDIKHSSMNVVNRLDMLLNGQLNGFVDIMVSSCKKALHTLFFLNGQLNGFVNLMASSCKKALHTLLFPLVD